MVIYSDTLTRGDLERIASGLGISLYNVRDFEGPRSRRAALVIRPLSDRFRSKSGGRRIWACSWEGHYAFMAGVFTLDADARIKSGLADYRGRSDFYASAPDTGARNIGSEFEPVPYASAQVEPTRTLEELQAMGEAAARGAVTVL